jgi:hypothetical protein
MTRRVMWERPAADPGRSPKLCPHWEPAAQVIEVHIYTEGTMDRKQNQTEGEMRKVLLGCCLTARVAVPVIAQRGSTPQAPPTDPLAIEIVEVIRVPPPPILERNEDRIWNTCMQEWL